MPPVEEIQNRVGAYIAWLRDRTRLRAVAGDWVEITTPYLDKHNDFIQIYAKRRDGGYLLTDDGFTLRELEQSGCSISSPKRRAILETTMRGFGLREEDDALTVHATEHDFAVRKHMLIQGMLAIGDMFYLAQPTVVTLFLEQVAGWLSENRVRFSQNVKLTGRSGYDHVFDFLVPKSEAQPERLMKAFNIPDKNAAESMILAWVDTKEARPEESQAYAFLNDAERAAPASVVDALEKYEIVPVLWSRRTDYQSALVN